MPSSGGGDGVDVGGSVSVGGEDASGVSGGLPDGVVVSGVSSASVAFDEHAGESDASFEEAFSCGGGVSEPQFV